MCINDLLKRSPPPFPLHLSLPLSLPSNPVRSRPILILIPFSPLPPNPAILPPIWILRPSYLFPPVGIHFDAQIVLPVGYGNHLPWWIGIPAAKVSSSDIWPSCCTPGECPSLALQQITELKKENFNLKLRIYFLEERMQQEFAGPTEHIYKTVNTRFWLLSLLSFSLEDI